METQLHVQVSQIYIFKLYVKHVLYHTVEINNAVLAAAQIE